ncbi:mechanosensitive ion channel family protein [Thiobacter aerophilum]|uniref:Small-conductance mechanosensitive channel n=1 Tax=Thiobacter aerophilum TaxID=3121275 RepID=A0ABV0ECN2_9BURK
MQQELDIFLASFNAVIRQLADFLPKLLVALLLLFVGWLVAKLARSAVRRLLALAHFDTLAEKTGIEEFLKHGEMQITLSGIIAEVSYWLVLFIVLVTVSNSLGLTAVAELFNRVVLYLPNIVVAVLIIIFGTLLARFINRLVFAWLRNLEIEGALTISTIAEYTVQIFAVFVALEQLAVATHLLITAFAIVFGAACLALALAFGLGGRDWAAGVIQKWASRGKKP